MNEELKKELQGIVDASNPCEGCGSLLCERVLALAKKYNLTLKSKEERFKEGEQFKAA